jgi:putative transposase
VSDGLRLAPLHRWITILALLLNGYFLRIPFFRSILININDLIAAMNFHPHHLYHVYNQGNNRQLIFNSGDDCQTFLNMAVTSLLPHGSMVAYCLMPNHFHFMLGTDERVTELVKQGGLLLDPLTNSIRRLLTGYARVYNQRNQRSGSLFRQKTKALCLTDMDAAKKPLTGGRSHVFNCFHYIHQNPLRAKLVTSLSDWPYSSFREYAGLQSDKFCNKELAALYCEFEPVTFVNLSQQLIPEAFAQDVLWNRPGGNSNSSTDVKDNL